MKYRPQSSLFSNSIKQKFCVRYKQTPKINYECHHLEICIYYHIISFIHAKYSHVSVSHKELTGEISYSSTLRARHLTTCWPPSFASCINLYVSYNKRQTNKRPCSFLNAASSLAYSLTSTVWTNNAHPPPSSHFI